MGVEASKPKPGATLQVIGAGLSRTGTSSFSAALGILLDGPVYHSGTQILMTDDETAIKTQIEILERTPYRSEADKEFVKEKLKFLLDGYVAATDTPMAQFVPELLELYPDAKVICTVRDVDAWVKSMAALGSSTNQGFLSVILFWVPVSRYFAQWVQALVTGRWKELYEPNDNAKFDENNRKCWYKHEEYLRRSVPADRLMFFNVKDGWGPLCKMLDCPVPEEIDFPRINDAKSTQEVGKQAVAKGLRRWVAVLSVTAVGVGIGWRLWQRST